MDYEEKYKEALERARQIQNTPYTAHWDVMKELVEDLFPELKESEDERIRKALLEMVHDTTGDSLWIDYNVHKEDAIAWLEKQGEQKPAGQSKIKPKFKIGDRVIGVISGMQYFITKVCDDHYNTESGCIIMFCSQDNFELYKQNLAWSEEDDVMINKLLAIVKLYYDRSGNDLDKQSCISFLKSLRPQNHWKPSKEQMEALDMFIYCKEPNTEKYGEAIKSLYRDLKKLKD